MRSISNVSIFISISYRTPVLASIAAFTHLLATRDLGTVVEDRQSRVL
jgi:hypothetical protein